MEWMYLDGVHIPNATTTALCHEIMRNKCGQAWACQQQVQHCSLITFQRSWKITSTTERYSPQNFTKLEKSTAHKHLVVNAGKHSFPQRDKNATETTSFVKRRYHVEIQLRPPQRGVLHREVSVVGSNEGGEHLTHNDCDRANSVKEKILGSPTVELKSVIHYMGWPTGQSLHMEHQPQFKASPGRGSSTSSGPGDEFLHQTNLPQRC